MRTRNFALAALVALALPVGAAAQVGTPVPEQGRPQTEGQREGRRGEGQRGAMRERIHARFLDMAAERLELDANQRTRLAAVLDRNDEERREIAEDGMRLRHEAAEVLGTDNPDGARAERILNELTRLRERELQLWRAEQDALAGVLSPAQRLELMAMQARFNERVRDMRHERGPGGRGHGGGRGQGRGEGFGRTPPGARP